MEPAAPTTRRTLSALYRGPNPVLWGPHASQQSGNGDIFGSHGMFLVNSGVVASSCADQWFGAGPFLPYSNTVKARRGN